jgi:hypothetical protein
MDHSNELEIIKQLMTELQDKMKYGEDDLSERMGREKPGVSVMKIEGEVPADKMSMDDDSSPMMDKDPMASDDDMEFDDEEGMFKQKSPGDDLKKRLMALRGR